MKNMRMKLILLFAATSLLAACGSTKSNAKRNATAADKGAIATSGPTSSDKNHSSIDGSATIQVAANNSAIVVVPQKSKAALTIEPKTDPSDDGKSFPINFKCVDDVVKVSGRANSATDQTDKSILARFNSPEQFILLNPGSVALLTNNTDSVNEKIVGNFDLTNAASVVSSNGDSSSSDTTAVDNSSSKANKGNDRKQRLINPTANTAAAVAGFAKILKQSSQIDFKCGGTATGNLSLTDDQAQALGKDDSKVEVKVITAAKNNIDNPDIEPVDIDASDKLTNTTPRSIGIICVSNIADPAAAVTNSDQPIQEADVEVASAVSPGTLTKKNNVITLQVGSKILIRRKRVQAVAAATTTSSIAGSEHREIASIAGAWATVKSWFTSSSPDSGSDKTAATPPAANPTPTPTPTASAATPDVTPAVTTPAASASNPPAVTAATPAPAQPAAPAVTPPAAPAPDQAAAKDAAATPDSDSDKASVDDAAASSDDSAATANMANSIKNEKQFVLISCEAN